jgi:hypothetical protein
LYLFHAFVVVDKDNAPEKLRMNFWKIFAILLAVFSLGALNETSRILTSQDIDIAENRASLIPMSFFMTSIFIFGTIYCWRKSKQKRF